MSVVVVLCCCCQNWKKHSAWTSEILSNKLRWNITEKNSSWGKRSCQRVNQAWDKPGRHGFWSQEKFPNLVLRNLKPKKYSTTLSLGRKMAGTSAATWATSASWRNWESWNFLYHVPLDLAEFKNTGNVYYWRNRIHRKCFLQTSHKHIEHHLREKLIEEELLEDEKNENWDSIFFKFWWIFHVQTWLKKMFIGSASTISDSLCYKMFYLLLME